MGDRGKQAGHGENRGKRQANVGNLLAVPLRNRHRWCLALTPPSFVYSPAVCMLFLVAGASRHGQAGRHPRQAHALGTNLFSSLSSCLPPHILYTFAPCLPFLHILWKACCVR